MNTIEAKFKNILVDGMDFSMPLAYGQLKNISMGSGQGKTMTALTLALNLVHEGLNVAFIVGDEGIEGVGRRLYKLEKALNTDYLNGGDCGRFIIDDAVVDGEFNLEKLSWIMKHNNDVVVIDSPYAEHKASEIEQLVEDFNMVGVMTKQARIKTSCSCNSCFEPIPSVETLDEDDLVTIGPY